MSKNRLEEIFPDFLSQMPISPITFYFWNSFQKGYPFCKFSIFMLLFIRGSYGKVEEISLKTCTFPNCFQTQKRKRFKFSFEYCLTCILILS